MIPDKQKDNHKMTLLLQRPDNDLCNQFNKLDLKHSETSKNNNYSKSNDETQIKNEFESNIDAINKIEEKFSNIKIVNENDVSANSDKINNTFSKHEFNIECDNFQNENEFKDEHTRSIQDQNVCDDVNNSESEKPNVSYIDETNKEEKGEEKNAPDKTLFLTCDVQKEDNDNNVNENQNDFQEESKKSEKNDNLLCSRGPIFTQKFNQQSSQPYDRGTWTTNSINSKSAFFSGCNVLHVAEPVGQPVPVNSYQQWNDIPNFNIIQNGFAENSLYTLPVPFSSSSSPVDPVGPVAPIASVGPVAPIASVGPVSPIASVGPVAPIASVGPVAPIASVGPVAPIASVGPVAPIASVGPVAPIASVGPVAPIASVGPDVRISPTAPIATNATPAPAAFACATPSGQTSYSSDSVGNENDVFDDEAVIKAIWNDYPMIRIIVKECNNNNTEIKGNMPPEENWRDEGLPRSPSTLERSPPESPCGSLQHAPPSTSEVDSGKGSPQPLVDNMFDNSLQSLPGERTAIWVQTTQEKQKRPDVFILPKPTTSVKARFQMILDPERRLQAWAKIQSNNDNFFLKGDVDGDTQLMIVVSNDYEGQLELIYAMVERMRKIPNSLNVTNNDGFSALYLACKLLNKQPLVAAYIAEALLEQNVNVADLRYENGLTLPEILENEGETHDAVLKELLSLKDGCGKFVFPKQNEYNFNFKNTTENLLNLHICL